MGGQTSARDSGCEGHTSPLSCVTGGRPRCHGRTGDNMLVLRLQRLETGRQVFLGKGRQMRLADG